MMLTRRMIQLMRAQEALTRVLEIRQATLQAEIVRLRQVQDEMTVSLSKDNAAVVMAGTGGLQRLAAAAGSLLHAEEAARRLGGELRLAKGRRDKLARRLSDLEADRDRQQQQTDGLEAAVGSLQKLPARRTC